jgi:hypothetical protein
MSKKLNVLGLRFGHLTALERVGRHPTQRTAIWKWRCDCGNEREIEARRVVAGHTRTCGKCELKHKLTSESVSNKSALGKRVTREYQRYIEKAKRRRKKWQLTLEEFSQLVTSNCTLCNTPPSLQHLNRIEPASSEMQYTLGGVYVQCPKCEQTYSKVGISQIIERIFAAHKHLSSL